MRLIPKCIYISEIHTGILMWCWRIEFFLCAYKVIEHNFHFKSFIEKKGGREEELVAE